MTTTFLESGGDATGGLEFYAFIAGGGVSVQPSSVLVPSRTGPSMVLVSSGAGGLLAYVQTPNGSVSTPTTTTSTGQLNCFFRIDAVALNNQSIVSLQTNGGSGVTVFQVGLTTGGLLNITDNALNVLATSSSGPVSATGVRFTLLWNITSLVVNTIQILLNGVSVLSLVNGNLNAAWSAGGTSSIRLGWHVPGPGALRTIYIDDVYITDSSAMTDPGDVRVTAKLPAVLNTNNFDTLGGSGANRYNRVSDRPLNAANYIVHLGGTDVQENFGLQTVAQGDVDITGSAYVGRTAWIWAKRATAATTPNATGSGAANSLGTTIAATLSAAVAIGDVVIVAVADQMGGVAPTIADTGVNTWTALSGPTTNTVRASKWMSVVTVAGTLTITATFGSATASRAIVAVAFDAANFSGAPLDKNVTNANDSTTPFTCPTTGVLSQALEFVLAFNFAAFNVVVTATSPNLLGKAVASTGGASAATNSAVAIGYQSVAATTAIAPVFAGTSATSVQGTASLKRFTRVTGTPQLMDNGSESAIVLTTSPALYTVTS